MELWTLRRLLFRHAISRTLSNALINIRRVMQDAIILEQWRNLQIYIELLPENTVIKVGDEVSISIFLSFIEKQEPLIECVLTTLVNVSTQQVHLSTQCSSQQLLDWEACGQSMYGKKKYHSNNRKKAMAFTARYNGKQVLLLLSLPTSYFHG